MNTNDFYVGRFVFLERKDPSKGNYAGGEKICVKASPNNLYCVGTGGGYNSHQVKAYPLIGAEAWTVLSSHRNDKAILQFAEDLQRFSRPTGAKQWVDSVYSEAASTARQLFDLLNVQPQAPNSARERLLKAAQEVLSGKVTVSALDLKEALDGK